MTLIRLVLGAVFAASPLPAGAYQREDHYLTVRAALGAVRPRAGGEALIAVCAQLPDEAPELSAIDVYRRLMKHPLDYAGWVLRKKGPAATVGRFVTVQQLLHGLTGGYPEAVREVARSVARDVLAEERALPGGARRARADALCALGFAYHLYGDSFSHQMLKNPEKMYKTGIGHLFDSSMPDLPLYSRGRLELWKRYVSSSEDLVPHDEAADMSRLMGEAEQTRRTAADRNGYNQAALRGLLGEQLRSEGVEAPYVPFDRSIRGKGCQAIVDRQAAVNGIEAAPSCDGAWALFSGLAIREYEAYDADPAHARKSRNPAFVRVPYFRGSPFSPGPKW